MHELWAALCLVFVIEGLILLAAPRGWQHMVQQAAQMPPRTLRICGAIAAAVGLLVLQLLP